MKKEITKKEYAYLHGYKKPHLIDYLVNWTIEEREGGLTVRGNWYLLVKILGTLPLIALILIYSLWDGGLKNAFPEIQCMWEIEPMYECTNYYTNSRYARMKKVYEAH